MVLDSGNHVGIPDSLQVKLGSGFQSLAGFATGQSAVYYLWWYIRRKQIIYVDFVTDMGINASLI